MEFIYSYSPFSDTLHNIPAAGVLLKSIGAQLFTPPDINHMCVMHYQIVLNITFPELK